MGGTTVAVSTLSCTNYGAIRILWNGLKSAMKDRTCLVETADNGGGRIQCRILVEARAGSAIFPIADKCCNPRCFETSAILRMELRHAP